MKKHLLATILYGSFLLALSVLVLATYKGQSELWVNQRFDERLGFFFKYFTHLGDGLMFALIFIGFLLYRYYFAILTAFLLIIQALIVQVMKRVVFASSPRPKAFFQGVEGITLQFVESVKVHSSNSFPSGHTATAFAIATFLTVYFKKPALTITFFLCAALVGFSRVYLLQHFFEDVLTGAAIGILSTILTFYLVPKAFPRLQANPKFEAGLLK